MSRTSREDFDTIRARQIQLVDENGNVVGTWHVESNDGHSEAVLTMGAPVPAVSIVASADGGAVTVSKPGGLRDAQLNTRGPRWGLFVNSTFNTHAELSVTDDDAVLEMAQGFDLRKIDPAGHETPTDHQQVVRLRAEASHRGAARIQTWEPDGTLSGTLP